MRVDASQAKQRHTGAANMGITKNLWLIQNGLPTVHDALELIKKEPKQGNLFDWDDDPGEDQWERIVGTCLTCEETDVEIATGVMGAVDAECWGCYGERMNDTPNSYDRMVAN